MLNKMYPKPFLVNSIDLFVLKMVLNGDMWNSTLPIKTKRYQIERTNLKTKVSFYTQHLDANLLRVYDYMKYVGAIFTCKTIKKNVILQKRSRKFTYKKKMNIKISWSRFTNFIFPNVYYQIFTTFFDVYLLYLDRCIHWPYLYPFFLNNFKVSIRRIVNNI